MSVKKSKSSGWIIEDWKLKQNFLMVARCRSQYKNSNKKCNVIGVYMPAAA